ncbi:MAG: sialic acid-specific 9-O-acetylesterase [Elusimicrobia bacterium]|nr:sialic acid-specific 9-O-acetylesterase [Elusimicrobiota bacterium]MBD3412129.1 sialic acid-specific 9-O-acetylesterase [Elusimicrobiota bacterium]
MNSFEIAGKDKIFKNAKAVIHNNTVEVYSQMINEPIAVRYAWYENVVGNLGNNEGLPASPFRTDKWK